MTLNDFGFLTAFDINPDKVRERVRFLFNAAGGSFLHKGDDNRYLTNCYFPSAVKLD